VSCSGAFGRIAAYPLANLRAHSGALPLNELIISLLEMSEYGGVDANSIKMGINSIFNEENGVIKLSEDNYKNMLVSATTDGTSVNTRAYNGILTQLSQTSGWLLTVLFTVQITASSLSSNQQCKTQT
jgi:hypothetical protein